MYAMSMLDEDEEYENDMLYERRGTPVLRSARPELVVPTPLTSRRWTGAPNSKLWPRACAATGKRVSMSGAAAPVSRPAVLGGKRQKEEEEEQPQRKATKRARRRIERALSWVGRSEVPTQSDRPSQSASVHVSLRGAVRRVSCLSEK